MLAQIAISTAISIVSGTLIMYGMVAFFRHKVKFFNVVIINIAADIAAGILEVYTEPLIARGICILLMVILLKHFAEMKSWVSVFLISGFTNVCTSVIVFGTMEMAILPMLNQI
jgi:hypothetical protein